MEESLNLDVLPFLDSFFTLLSVVSAVKFSAFGASNCI